MKIKKIYLALCAFMFVSSESKTNNNGPLQSQKTGTNVTVEAQDLLGDITPLEFSTKNLQAYFKSVNPAEEVVSPLKTRVMQHDAKILQFNKSFSKYIKNVYNYKNYELMLSQDGSHVLEFLKLCEELDLGPGTAYVGLRLFYNKIKACEIIDDTVLIQLLEKLPVLLEPYFNDDSEAKPQDLVFIKKHVETLIFSRLVDRFAEFQKKPDAFVSGLARSIVDIMKKEADAKTAAEEKKEMKDRLYGITMRFMDTALQRVIWYSKTENAEDIWRSFTGIAAGLQQLAMHNVVGHMDDLDDLFWSLTHRFGFFLDLAGATLPLKFYELAENELANKTVFFLEAKEQDDGIKTKKEVLFEKMFSAKVKAVAFEERGIIPRGMAY